MRELTIRLYKFSELDRIVQESIAWRWLALEGTEENQGSLKYALECLATEPDEKYLADGQEFVE